MKLTRQFSPTLARLAPWQQATLLSGLIVGSLLVVLAGSLAVPGTFVVLVLVALGLQASIFAVSDRQLDAVPDRGRLLTTATVLTTCRGSAAVVLAGFLVVERPTGMLVWLPALLFGAAALLDGVDGQLARATGTESAFGSRLDTEMDSLALLIGVAVAIRFGQAPLVFLLVGLARYAFVAGIIRRRWQGIRVGELPARSSRRILGAGMMGVVFCLLTPVLDGNQGGVLAIVAMVPFLLGFVRDWWLLTRRE